MKKNNILAALFVATAFGLASTSCTNDDEFLNEDQTTGNQNGAVKTKTISLVGSSYGDKSTRTEGYSEENLQIRFRWETYDKISISKDGNTFYDCNMYTDYSEDFTTARFFIENFPEGEDITQYHVYPNWFGLPDMMLNANPNYAGVKDLNGSGMGGDRAFAKTIRPDGSFTLEHQLSYFAINVSLPSDFAQGSVTSISIKANNAPISGMSIMDLNDGKVTGSDDFGTRSVTYIPVNSDGDLGDGTTPKTYYMMCIPTTDTLTITATISDGSNTREYSAKRVSGVEKNTTYGVRFPNN